MSSVDDDQPPDTLSVVLPFHQGVPASQLRAALQSLGDQTRLPEEIIVVADGPVTEEHEAVLASFDAPPALTVIRIPENRGPGVANQAGLLAARGTWIAKADADDLSRPKRLESQLACARTLNADVVGTSMAEFASDPAVTSGIRSCPESHDAIARRMRLNTPLNHPTIVYRRDLAVAVGGYPPVRHMEDWDLLARMLSAGARMHNLQEPLVLFRSDDQMLRRRTSRSMLRDTVAMQRNLRSYGIIGPVRQYTNLAARALVALLPAPLLRRLYRSLFVRRIAP